MTRAPTLRIAHDELIVDNFAGGGGASLGIEWALGRSPDIAINHDREAIAMHEANHPRTRHYCEDVWKVDPAEACRGRSVALAWFSPDCKHFSKAKGGRPVDKRIRGLAWVVVRWAKAVRPRVIILENVEEFADWGPLLEDGRPCPMRKGHTFRRWVGQLRAAGYEVDWRELAACDYGAPTTRKRLFLVARRDGQPITWPAPTHGYNLVPYRAAWECLDFSLPTYSIFLTKEEGKRYGVKRPLVDNTMRRVARGTWKFVIDCPQPFIVGLAHGEFSKRAGSRSHSLSEPLRTIHAGGNNHALVAPYLVPRYGEDVGQSPRCRTVEAPMPTIVPAANGAQLVTAFLAKHYGGHETPGSEISKPLDTVTAKDHNALVASWLLKLKGTCQHGQQMRLPLATVQAGGYHYAETRAFLVKYYGSNDALSVHEPMRTVTALDRFGLVTVHGEPYMIADIGMRMLAPPELYLAQSFPANHIIAPVVDGRPLPKDAQVRMCGNSVPPVMAQVMARAQFEEQVAEVAA